MKDIDEPDPRTSRFRDQLLCVLTGLVAFIGLAAIGWPLLTRGGGFRVHEKANRTKAINNARQITLALKLYAADNHGIYPDDRLVGVTSSNIVFDQLIQTGIVTSEPIFGSPNSDLEPDGDLSTRLADLPDQVHWALVTGRNDASDGGSAIVFENPVARSGIGSATWGPPGTVERGRSWSESRIVIGTNDGSVQTFALDPTTHQIDGNKNPDPLVRENPETGTEEELPWVSGH